MVRHRLDVAAAIALTAAVLWASRDVLGIRDVYPDDANRALVATAQSFAEFRRASGTEVGQSATIATVLRATGSVTAAQVPSLVMAIAGPVLVYVAARRASLTRVAALAAGLLLACGREWSFHAGSLKANTWGGVATAALIVMATPLIEARGAIEPRRWIPLIAVAAVASVCTIFGVLASMSVAACIGVLCVRAPVKRRGALVAIGALAVGLFAWWAVVMRSTGDVRNSVAYEWFRTDDLVASTHDRFVAIGTGFAPWTADYAGRSNFAGLTLLLLGTVGIVVLIRRASALGWLALFPIATALGLAVAHVLPIGIRFDTWFFPSLALACGGAVDEALRRLPRVLTVASLLAMATVVVIMVNGLPYPEVRPSFRPVAAAAAAIPPSECVVLDKVHLAQWAWDTRWDIEILGQVPGDTWAVIGFPGRCVSIPGYGPEWTGSSVLHTLDPPGERVWWIHPTGARGAVPESLVLDSETNHNGFTIASFVRR